jgi:AcrR family transcriptional regulator
VGVFEQVNQATLQSSFEGTVRPVLYDPAQPIFPFPGPGSSRAAPSRRNQRLRRAQILATIRQLLAEQGLGGVTVRGIAQVSGHAVQTIYNLVGPRDQAIVEAISEYTRYVGQTAVPDPADPDAVVEMIGRWLQSIEAAPEFCRQVCLIFFTPSRAIFYHFRDKQLKSMQGLLARQQKCGILRADAHLPDLAEQLVTLASASCVEWSDRAVPLEQLHRRIYTGFANLLDGALNPASGAVGWSDRQRSY